jgi:GT2 family glycosyltransferase
VQRAAQDIDYEIYVVDNDSRDDTVRYVTKRFRDEVNLVESQHNLGFARANNIAIRQSESEYVLLLNPDTFISEDSLRQVITFMDEHPKAGGVGVKMFNSNATIARESRRGLPTPWVSLQKMMGFSRRYYLSDLPWDQPAQIEVMSGAFCMLRRDVLNKIGLLDKDFFMYGEDIDLSYRILKGGFENWYVPASIVHYKGESTQKSSYRYVHVFYQAMLIFFRKHYGHLSFFVTIPIKTAIYFRAFIALIRMQYARMRHSLGFDMRDHTDTNYFFVGSAAMIEQCRKLARRKGLLARFQTTRELPLPHVDIEPGTCVVYDTDFFSFQQVIDDAARLADKSITIGTYCRSSKTIITPTEIIR